jgi:transcriptional regulator with GAF, ATPase, and Fis domain
MATDPREWRRLMEAGAAFTAYMDLDDVLRQVLPYAAESAHAEWSAVVLHDAEARELVVAAAGGSAAGQVRGRRFPDDEGIAGSVLRSGQPRIVADTTEAAHLLREIERDGHAVRTLMAAPLRVGTRTLGVVEAVNRVGGGEFLPSDLERFVGSCSLIAVAVENASLYRRLDKETEILKRTAEDAARPLVAESPAMKRVLAQARRVAAGRSTVLLVGETGTGKEQVARRIHVESPRGRMPFVALNCGALPEGLLESELFGHEKGAFTGADRRRIGRFELADGGTLFLDEIAELPPAAQVKLLRVLQEHEIGRVGGTETIRVDVRLIVATHRDLAAEVRAGRFREDLFFRVHVVPIHLPPLRERTEDVEPIARRLLERLSRELGRAPRELAPGALDRLRAHAWPGNVRELENLIERLLVLGEDSAITTEELGELLPAVSSPSAVPPAAGAGDPLSLPEQERRLLMEALERCGRNQTRAAALLKISREKLRTRMKRYGLLDPPRR